MGRIIRGRMTSWSASIEHIVSFLIDEEMLGGFHFNDRKYADDDLTLGSIDPYAVFRIFHEIRNAAELHEKDVSTIAYMIDQSHNLKPKSEAMIQTVGLCWRNGGGKKESSRSRWLRIEPVATRRGWQKRGSKADQSTTGKTILT